MKFTVFWMVAFATVCRCSEGEEPSSTPVHTTATIDKNIYAAYRSFWPELEMTAKFGKLGINTRCFFAANTINSAGFEYCKYPPIWLAVNKYDFSAYDKQIDDLIAANPQARFLCMIDLNTPYWLTRKLAHDSFDAISHAASDPQWIQITTKWMRDFIEYSEKKYGDRIQAYILSGGGTSEWYEYDRGRSSRVKNTAWRAWCKKNGHEFAEDVPCESSLLKAAHENVIYDPSTELEKIRYWQFHNEVIADAILHFAKEARSMLGGKKEIGVFFGYYMVSDSKLVSFGHLDYERVFASPDIDFVIGPGTYNDRMIGGGTGPQLVRGTALRYGKRYLHEIDHRTHYVAKTWKTQEEDEAGLKREAAFALVNHASHWWFDMWGGWYQNKETRQLIGQLQKLWEAYGNDRTVVWVYAPGICDGTSLDTARVERWTGSAYRTVGPAKVAMDGWTSVYAYEYKTMTPAALREILHAAGVHLYIEGENPVFANQRLMAVHCKTGGEKTVALPRSYRKVVDVLSGTIVAEDSSSFVHRFRTPDTTLFELVE